jgi:hypothetical protein
MKITAVPPPAVCPLILLALALGSSSLCGQDVNWTATGAPFTNWQAIACSSDGTKVVALVFGGGIYSTTNSGSTWTPTSAPVTNWRSASSSSDGTKLVSVANGGGIYASVDSGLTWTQATSAPVTNWASVASSADGANCVAVVENGGIYTSINAGFTWTPTSAPSQNWQSVASSSEGNKLVAVVQDGGIYISANSGGTWTKTSAQNLSWQSIASSSDGTKLVAVVQNGGIYTSTNSGVAWTPTSAPNLTWQSVASSSDGMKLVAVALTDAIYISTNSGVAWTPTIAPNLPWQSVASSSDGTQMLAGVYGGGIYTDIIPGISLQPESVVSCPGISAGFEISASGIPPLGFQWRKNGTNLFETATLIGAATTNLTLLDVSLDDSGSYDVIVTNPYAAVTSSVATLIVSPIPAKARPILVNGFIIGATLIDGGCGYTSPPVLFFDGQGGSGAAGYGEISNGAVTNIWITSAGFGYPTNTVLQVAPPIFPTLEIARGPLNPPGAAASAIVTNGFVVGAKLTAGGSDYPLPPVVAFSDITGRGASAYTQITNGSVVKIVVTNAGWGYSSNTLLSIAAPPTVYAVIPGAIGLMVGESYQLKTTYNLNSWTWTNSGSAFTATNTTWASTKYWNVTATNRIFFRLQVLP